MHKIIYFALQLFILITSIEGRFLDADIQQLNTPISIPSDQYTMTIRDKGRTLDSTSQFDELQAPNDVLGLMVALQSSFGRYLSFPDNNQRCVTKEVQGIWEQVIINKNNDGTYNLKTYFNTYGRGDQLNYINQATSVGPWEEWNFLPSGDNDGKWCIQNNNFKYYISANGDGWVGTQSYCGPWEKWSVNLIQVVDYVDIQYDLSSATTIPLQPLVLAEGVSDATNSSIPQTETFSFSQTMTTTSSFSSTKGVTLSASTDIKAKIPILVDQSITLSAEYSQSWTYGGSDQISQAFTASFPVTAPAGKKYKGVATVQQSSVTISYQGIVYYKGTSITSQVTGTWTGVEYYNLQYVVTDIT